MSNEVASDHAPSQTNSWQKEAKKAIAARDEAKRKLNEALENITRLNRQNNEALSRSIEDGLVWDFFINLADFHSVIDLMSNLITEAEKQDKAIARIDCPSEIIRYFRLIPPFRESNAGDYARGLVGHFMSIEIHLNNHLIPISIPEIETTNKDEKNSFIRIYANEIHPIEPVNWLSTKKSTNTINQITNLFGDETNIPKEIADIPQRIYAELGMQPRDIRALNLEHAEVATNPVISLMELKTKGKESLRGIADIAVHGMVKEIRANKATSISEIHVLPAHAPEMLRAGWVIFCECEFVKESH